MGATSTSTASRRRWQRRGHGQTPREPVGHRHRRRQPPRATSAPTTRVNAICPRFIDTDITAGLLKPDKLQAIIASVPMGRPGHAHEVAGCALFLACDQQSSYVTGGEIDINDGSHIQ